MRESQGELGKIDLTSGGEIIRIYLDNFRYAEDNYMLYYEGVKLVVGQVTDDVEPNNPIIYCGIWNNRLRVLKEQKFYEIGKKRNDEKWYGTKEESIAQQNIRSMRNLNKPGIAKHLPEYAKKIVLPFVRRQPKLHSARLSDITSVTKQIKQQYNSEYKYVPCTCYEVKVKNKTLVLR